MKRCYVCRQTKPESEFHKNAARPDGLQCECKVCKRVMNAMQRRGEKIQNTSAGYQRVDPVPLMQAHQIWR